MKLNKQIILAILISVILSGTIGVGAGILLNAGDIYYSPKDNAWRVDTIEDALNELFDNSYSIRNSCEVAVSEPKLGEKLIPITLGDGGTVTYADTSKEWYNYCEKEWANAVILIDSPSKKYVANDVILESDIESYFVWIPKYEYKLWNTGTASKKAHLIEIRFSTENTVDEEGVSCVTPMTSGNLGNCNNGEWMTHPAFISMDVDGLWVGKFETGYNGATSISTAQVNSNDSTKIIVKPNVFSWRNNTIYNFFVSSYNYERDLDSHMIKNTEWGAVVYLSHSRYGINQEIAINNNSSYKTGYTALPSLSQHIYPGTSGDGLAYNSAYNKVAEYSASSTGNITGVYDLSGGAHEYMAAYRENTLGSSGFTTTTIATYDAKYFDVYNASSTQTTYRYMILGDATGEMGPFKSYADADGTDRYHNSWYADRSNFVESSNPWFHRGGNYVDGVLASQFSFGRYKGDVSSSYSSRLVLTI